MLGDRGVHIALLPSLQGHVTELHILGVLVFFLDEEEGDDILKAGTTARSTWDTKYGGPRSPVGVLKTMEARLASTWHPTFGRVSLLFLVRLSVSC